CTSTIGSGWPRRSRRRRGRASRVPASGRRAGRSAYPFPPCSRTDVHNLSDEEALNEPGIVPNGINDLTGEYLVPPRTPAEAAVRARGTPPAEQVSWLRRLGPRLKARTCHADPGPSFSYFSSSLRS